jgi:trehalose 6-phosphate phosphatase
MRLWLSQPCLLAFDFDGTLAPIVARPDMARPSPSAVRALTLLQRHHPVAIVTGRAVADVRPRLGFEPDAVVGSHGAESPWAPALGSPVAPDELVVALDGFRQDMAGPLGERLRAAGVTIEDKGASLALHYRLAQQRALAHSLAHEACASWAGRLKVFEGKMVFNVTALDAPDKADAVDLLQRHFGVAHACFAGDDVNDEPVFEQQREDWVTIKVGMPDGGGTAARFALGTPADLTVFLTACLRWNSAPLRAGWTQAGDSTASAPASHTTKG